MMLGATLAAGAQPEPAGQSPRCPAAQVKVSKIIEPQPDPSAQPVVPRSEAREPSVLLPKCTRKGDPKKQDYPLA